MPNRLIVMIKYLEIKCPEVYPESNDTNDLETDERETVFMRKLIYFFWIRFVRYFVTPSLSNFAEKFIKFDCLFILIKIGLFVNSILSKNYTCFKTFPNL